ncbi:MAG: alpha/beta fold hydrolase [Pseudomonadota bacterium]
MRMFLPCLALLAAPALAQDAWLTLPDAPAMPPPADSGVAPLDGAAMHWASYGDPDDSTPVLLIHGGLGHADLWAAQVADLSAENRVIVADTRGHGRSTNEDGAYSYDRLTADYVALLDHLGVERVDLVGWSDGANIGLAMALSHPQRLNSLFAHAGNVTLDGIDPAVAEDATFGAYVVAMGEDYAALSPTPDGFDAFLGGVAAMWETEKPGGLDALAAVDVPVIVVQSEHDEAILERHARDIAAAIPGAAYRELAGVSHFAMLQDPEGYSAAVRDWLAAVGE